ncbi:primosomal protein N' [Spiribacter halobius]|uniref:Replication restart protein PriA n=1 Tax=Sediminicurvatus halobius TaxID=2182432 RepID=A0A2U2N6Q6_9GAMM|nr:primosomal protein N' [Spiribacter halobius]PWG64856.1 primosomal protein N' [Spiribacter halobius]UEX78290.1 primosomal protein N' [Spiribacter halobius]
MSVAVVKVAVPGPLAGPLDYRAPAFPPPVGARVQVPLGRRRVVGVVTGHAGESELPPDRLRAVETVLDETPLLDTELLALLRWGAQYYHHPLGDCIATALPRRLRQGAPATPGEERYWRLTEAGAAANVTALRARAPRQALLLAELQAAGVLRPAQLPGMGGDARGALERLASRGWAEVVQRRDYGLIEGDSEDPAPALNREQADAAAALAAATGFTALLLDGVTGSGKTEVYLDAIARCLAAGRQALVIVPEIGLTPQLLTRFRRRLRGRLAVLHSGLADGERLDAWLAAREGVADVIIGTRSAVFTPLARPGLIVVDEEHDASLKQQDGFRYSARDLAVIRAQRLDLPVVLGSATPSLESLANAGRGRYRHLHLGERAGGARPPRFGLLDVRGRPMQEGLSQPLLQRVREHLDHDGQVLLFLNRRGYAPTLLCHECGWMAECERCDARYTYHRGRARLHCHHCDREQPLPRHCPECGSVDLRPLGLGTERVEAALEAAFPETSLVRIDRDSTRRRGSFETRMEAVRRGEARLLLGTQMLAKGHHLPAVTLVGIIDADQGLFGADFRAPERLAQLIVQVAGRAGRAERPGEVLIQTHHPEHPLLQTLIHHGYPAFAQAALAERQAAGLPPERSLALLRAEAPGAAAPRAFLDAARNTAPATRVELLGPLPAPMERRAGRYRAQLMLQADARRDLHALLDVWLPRVAALPEARRVRWSIDVDPVETL